ncbi:hypothetical protein AGLY_008582, partial [Aphis glycines]
VRNEMHERILYTDFKKRTLNQNPIITIKPCMIIILFLHDCHFHGRFSAYCTHSMTKFIMRTILSGEYLENAHLEFRIIFVDFFKSSIHTITRKKIHKDKTYIINSVFYFIQIEIIDKCNLFFELDNSAVSDLNIIIIHSNHTNIDETAAYCAPLSNRRHIVILVRNALIPCIFKLHQIIKLKIGHLPILSLLYCLIVVKLKFSTLVGNLLNLISLQHETLKYFKQTSRQNYLRQNYNWMFFDF